MGGDGAAGDVLGGPGGPFVAVGLGVGHALGGSPSLRRYVPAIRLTGAAVMVGAGILLVTGQFAALSARLGGLGDVAI